ncbi:uroporphyrinogen-III C-methyltransferase [Thorsellia anophelis]|uniref:Uroporphyrin-3 C-methyltransferase n=1 Tax=Thorsellia anophelis DSM 18579 TaxID=1123402 RepID=A0A1I0AVW2_9GAMM|nr:uroporphyrinogen-III C-methyltransferase [Thorsellia anophelis]SES97919.1 uroporphyrin-3 C-methyltransferase [Thorsellia anophelis DSM 18579]
MTKPKKTIKEDKSLNEVANNEFNNQENKTPNDDVNEDMSSENIVTSQNSDFVEESDGEKVQDSQVADSSNLTDTNQSEINTQLNTDSHAINQGNTQEINRSTKMSKTPLVMSLLALITTIGASAALFYYVNQQSAKQLEVITTQFQEREQAIRKEMEALKTTLDEKNRAAENENKRVMSIRDEFESALQTFEKQQANIQRTWTIEQETAQSQIAAIEDKVNRLATQDNTAWLVSQADFYIKMAARRLWSEKDVLTAMALLKTADSSLAEMNDSSLIQTRTAIASDIAALAALNPPDIDGIVARMSTLLNTVDTLVLKPEFRWVTDHINETTEPTNSISDWRQNLMANWRNFSNDFISIRKVDGAAEPILMPEQVVYLRENIRARLLLATQAVSRRQDRVYQDTINDVLTVINQYFDVDDKQTQHIISELSELQKQPLEMTLPEKFQSAELVARLVQDRVTKWVNQPVNQANSEDAQSPSNESHNSTHSSTTTQ